MDKRVWKVIGLLAVLALVFVIGAAAGGGIVFAASQTLGPYGEQMPAPDQDDEETGIVIVSVDPDGPAAQAGVRRGDILLKIDEQVVNHPRDLIDYLNTLATDEQVELTILHGDEQRTLTAVLGERGTRPYLGLTPCWGPPPEISLAVAGPGARVIAVAPGSPADEAGLQVGDLITSIDGQTLDSDASLADLIAEYAPGDRVTLEVQSPGQEPRQVSVELGEHPEEAGAAYLGVRYLPAPDIYQFEDKRFLFRAPHPPAMRPFTDEFRFALPEGDFEGGAVVRRVANDSPAETAGLKPGDVITAVDSQPVDSPDAVVDAVAGRQPGDVLKLTVFRPRENETIEIEVTLAEHPQEKGKAYLGVSMGGVFTIRKFRGDQGPLLPREPGRRFEFRLPVNPDNLPFHFDLEVEPWFHFETPPGDCCQDDFSNEA
ncbi:MAG: hypothetical protein Kow0063_14830 [Anaerolineae bacterium]